jgi:hypothetical protein
VLVVGVEFAVQRAQRQQPMVQRRGGGPGVLPRRQLRLNLRAGHGVARLVSDRAVDPVLQQRRHVLLPSAGERGQEARDRGGDGAACRFDGLIGEQVGARAQLPLLHDAELGPDRVSLFLGALRLAGTDADPGGDAALVGEDAFAEADPFPASGHY